MKQRLAALDAFRGMTIAAMILVNNPGSWSHIYWPLDHASWHGLTPTDLVFPFFLFIVGASMRYSFAAYNYEPTSKLLNKIFWRTVTIIVIGWMIHLFPFVKQDWNYSHFRIPGVLPRIGVVYGLASLMILFLDSKKQLYMAAILLVGYWIMMWFGGYGADHFGLQTNFERTIDLWVLGENHMYHGEGIAFDPEGILSTLPAIVTTWLGYRTAMMIQESTDYRALMRPMCISAAVLIVAGLAWHFIGFPLNKKIWTSSYVLVTGGLAVGFLALWLWIADIKQWKWLSFPFVVYGSNAIFAFIAIDLWAITLGKVKYMLNGKEISGSGYLYQTIFVPMAGELNGSLLFAIAHVIGLWLLLYWMWRKKIFVKI
jgi:predicted acyltransferase